MPIQPNLRLPSGDRVRIWLVSICLLTAVALGVWATLAGQGFSNSREAQRFIHDGKAPEPRVRSVSRPILLKQQVWISDGLDKKQIQKHVFRLRQERPPTLSDIIHLVRLFGKDSTMVAAAGRKDVACLDVVLDAEKSRKHFQGRSCLIETRAGVRCRVVERSMARAKQTERQAHTDQLLATLAEARIPLGEPISVGAEAHTVKDLLVDSLACFHLDQKEIEWSALAFTLYLPPRRSWTDKFGSPHNFDELAEELMVRKAEGRACGGLHLMYALASMLQVDSRTPILSEGRRKQVRKHLAGLVAAAEQNQDKRGFWGLDWTRNGASVNPVDDRLSSRVLVTGHMLEWLILLPPELLLPRDCMLRAACWLQQQLESASASELANDYCPYSHAGRVLLSLAATREE